MDPELRSLVAATWGIIAVAAGIGIVVFAVEQMLQDLLALRRHFQKREIPKIVQAIAVDLNRKIGIIDSWQTEGYKFERLVQRRDGEPLGRNVDPERALRNMIQLAIAGKADALYSLPIEQLSGQLSVAAQSVLDFPRTNPDLILILSSGSEVADLITVLAPPPIAMPRSAEHLPSPEEVAFVDARNRVAHQVQRNLDALQIHMGYWLQFYLQMWTIIFGVVATFLLFSFSVGIPTSRWELFRQWAVCGVLSGFFSALFSNTIGALLGRRGGR
jgi:hypothetical protein